MSAEKALLINISLETPCDWEGLVQEIDEFKAEGGSRIAIGGKDFLSYSRLPDLAQEAKKRGLELTARVIISADNYKDLPGIVLLLKNKGMAAVCFCQMEIPVLSSENYALLLSTTTMIPFLLKALKAAKKNGLAYTLENLPLCILPGQEDHFIRTGTAGIKMKFCTDCELNQRCGGITKTQLVAEYGTQLLSWQFLFPKDFISDHDISFLDEQLLKSSQ